LSLLWAEHLQRLRIETALSLVSRKTA